MSEAQFWDIKFAEDQASGQPLFAGDPNPVVAAYAEFAAVQIDKRNTALDPDVPTRRAAIDLGSGRGRHTVWLAREGWDTTALDFSTVGLENTQALLDAEGLSAQLIESDLADWDPLPRSYDLVVAAFIHLDKSELAPLWQKAAMSLTPGGFLVVIAHHPDNQVHGPGDEDVLYRPHEVVKAAGEGVDVVVADTRAEPVNGLQQIDTIVVLQKK